MIQKVKKLSDVLDKFINGSGSDEIPIGLTTNYKEGNESVNAGFNIDTFSKEVLVMVIKEVYIIRNLIILKKIQTYLLLTLENKGLSLKTVSKN